MSEKSPSDNCRLCSISFKVKFGNVAGKQSHSSSENLFKPSKRKDCFGVVLGNICRQVGLELIQDSQVFSDRVCNPCGRKIRNLGQLYQFVKAGTSKTASTPSKSSGKRDLDTPEKASPSWRKSKVVRVHSPAAKTPLREVNMSRKSLAFGTENMVSACASAAEDEMLRKLNVDDLPQTGLQVKVVYRNPSGQVIARIPRDEESKALVRNIACEKWREASNVVLKHEEIAAEVKQGISKAVSKEFNEYLKSGSMLELRNPDELAGFSNKLFMEEVRIFCPVWYDCVLGACGLSREDMQEGGRDVNSLALATATIARVRNTKASSIHYRISTILFHSGVKHDDLLRLNRMGICMSPDSIIRLQNKMNEQLEGRVKIWKGVIEENRGALKLAKEVERKQGSETQLDVNEQSLESYDFFSTEGYAALRKLLEEERTKANVAVYNAECVQAVIARLVNTRLPLYK
ncbi:uncharacterized protein [Montipora foliosa]|uniref:uncharacterized protein n=1 Tax=Montipora foliosa TaxID=591990 RepID=UPI0035F1F228